MYSINYHSKDRDFTKSSASAQGACIAAWHYMQAHPEVLQASIVDADTQEVVRVYIR